MIARVCSLRDSPVYPWDFWVPARYGVGGTTGRRSLLRIGTKRIKRYSSANEFCSKLRGQVGAGKLWWANR